MKKCLNNWLTLLLVLWSFIGQAQRYISDSSYVSFYSDAAVEDIEAINSDGSSIIDLGTGELAFIIPITGFQFEKSLMQTHFNESYLESEKYPRATFHATIVNWDDAMFGQPLTVWGEMKIHGVTQAFEVEGTISKSGEVLTVTSNFPVSIADYGIKIPTILFYNIAEVVDVSVYFKYKPYEED